MVPKFQDHRKVYMKVISGRIPGSRLKLHRIKDSKGRYISGSIVMKDPQGREVVVKRGDVIGTQDMIMMMEMGPWTLWKLFCYALFGIEEHKIQ